jgi:hypothetical protein
VKGEGCSVWAGRHADRKFTGSTGASVAATRNKIPRTNHSLLHPRSANDVIEQKEVNSSAERGHTQQLSPQLRVFEVEVIAFSLIKRCRSDAAGLCMGGRENAHRCLGT